MNPFRDQEKFMKACDQTVGSFNKDQFNLYVTLIEEEANELADAITAHNKAAVPISSDKYLLQ